MNVKKKPRIYDYWPFTTIYVMVPLQFLQVILLLCLLLKHENGSKSDHFTWSKRFSICKSAIIAPSPRNVSNNVLKNDICSLKVVKTKCTRNVLTIFKCNYRWPLPWYLILLKGQGQKSRSKDLGLFPGKNVKTFHSPIKCFHSLFTTCYSICMYI